MDQTAYQYAPFALFLLLAFIFATFTYTIGILFRPARRTPEKAKPYECGMDPIGPANRPVLPRYYFYAMLLVIFDVEAIFLIPWALNARTLGPAGLAAVFLFFLVLMAGYFYLWRKGDLDWD